MALKTFTTQEVDLIDRAVALSITLLEEGAKLNTPSSKTAEHAELLTGLKAIAAKIQL